MCSPWQIWHTPYVPWLKDRYMQHFLYCMATQAGMMETLAWSDSISERQLPCVNGGVILLEPLLCSTPFLQESTHHCLVCPAQGKRLMASAAHSVALSSLSLSASCLTVSVSLIVSSSLLPHSWFPGSITLDRCPYTSLSTCWSINHPSLFSGRKDASARKHLRQSRVRWRGEDSLTDCPQ